MHTLFCIFLVRSCFHKAREVAGEVSAALRCCAWHPLFWFIRWRDPAARQLSSVLVVPDLRCALVRPVGLVHEELLSGQDALLQIKQKRFNIRKRVLAAAVNGSNDSLCVDLETPILF